MFFLYGVIHRLVSLRRQHPSCHKTIRKPSWRLTDYLSMINSPKILIKKK